MSDVLYLVLVIGFFAVAMGLLRACGRIIGNDDNSEVTQP